MLIRSQLHAYQNTAIEHIKTHPSSMLWLDLGLGKTIASLTAAVDLMNTMQVYGVLVIAPLLVCQTVWEREALNWEHTQHLSFGLIHGDPKHRKWMVCRPHNFYVINYEGLQWGVDQFITQYLNKGRPLPFNMLICDEITKLKSSRYEGGGKWGQYLQKILPYIPYRTGLTATPAPNGLNDLFGQYLIMDDGERLGKYYKDFERFYFKSDYMGYNIEVTPEGKKFIHEAVADITIQMDAEDYLTLPDNRIHNIVVKLTDKVQKQYDKLEEKMFLELDSGEVLDIENKACLMNKCLQMASGAVYTDPEDRTHWEVIHKTKIDALMEVIESLQGDPLLLGYQFRHDAARIKERFKTDGINFIHYDSKIKGKEAQELEDNWNAGKYTVMLGHGQSIGHGLNLQYGCAYVAWYGLPWGLETFKQLNGRVIKRQGQKRKTTLIQILVENTVDYAVLYAQERKAETQDELRTAVNDYRKRKGV